MMLFDHGAPGPDGVVSRDQRREADVNIEFPVELGPWADESRGPGVPLQGRQRRPTPPTTPRRVGPHMSSTGLDAVHERPPRRSACERTSAACTSGAGWNPHWHQPTDLYVTYTDEDFRLGLNAAQTTLAAIAGLAGASNHRSLMARACWSPRPSAGRLRCRLWRTASKGSCSRRRPGNRRRPMKSVTRTRGRLAPRNASQARRFGPSPPLHDPAPQHFASLRSAAQTPSLLSPPPRRRGNVG